MKNATRKSSSVKFTSLSPSPKPLLLSAGQLEWIGGGRGLVKEVYEPTGG